MPRSIELLETLRLEDGSVSRLARHLRRLTRSARYFGFADLDEAIVRIEREIGAQAAEHSAGVYRLRVVLKADGTGIVTSQPHSSDTRPRCLALSRRPVDSRDRHLYHKLADRSLYADRLAEANGADDVVLVNERGELTETTIGNIILEIDGQRVTPAIDCGLLPGIFRETLLEHGEIREAILRPEDLKRATRVWMINSLRGWVECVRSAS